MSDLGDCIVRIVSSPGLLHSHSLEHGGVGGGTGQL